MQLLRKIALPISLLYGIAIYIRNYLYDIGFYQSKSFTTPTICIGNLSVGGTGKTPMTEYLIRSFKDKYKIAVLSRGYKRKSKGYQLADESSTVEDLGDEPFQIYTKFSDILLAVDSDRCNGISKLEQNHDPDLILLDDAFQHRRVKPAFNLLLTAFDNLYIDDVFLPTGSLRDAKNQVERANMIVVTKCPKNISTEEIRSVECKLKTQKPVVFATLLYDTVLRSNIGELNLSELDGKKVALVTGIAKPKPLVEQLRFQNISFEHLAFNDHYFFKQKDVAKFKTYDYIITTEKDYVRLNDRVAGVFYLEVRHQFLFDGAEQLLNAVEDSIKHRH